MQHLQFPMATWESWDVSQLPRYCPPVTAHVMMTFLDIGNSYVNVREIKTNRSSGAR